MVVFVYHLELFSRIKRAAYTFDELHWGHIDQKCKDLVAGLLVVDPAKRLTASEALKTPWVSNNIL